MSLHLNHREYAFLPGQYPRGFSLEHFCFSSEELCNIYPGDRGSISLTQCSHTKEHWGRHSTFHIIFIASFLFIIYFTVALPYLLLSLAFLRFTLFNGNFWFLGGVGLWGIEDRIIRSGHLSEIFWRVLVFSNPCFILVSCRNRYH